MVKIVFGRSIRKAILFGVILTLILGRTESGTCIYNINASRVLVWSPNYPNFYPNNIHCIWNFQAPPGSVFEIVFQDMQVERCSDYVTLYDGDPDSEENFGVSLGIFCSKPERPIISTSNRIQMSFRSDRNTQFRGFKVLVSRVPRNMREDGNSSLCEVGESNVLERVSVSIPQDKSPSPSVEDGIDQNHLVQFLPEPGLCDALTEFDLHTLTQSDLNNDTTDCIGRYLTRYLLNNKRQHTAATSKWGADIAKTAVALFLQDPEFFATDNETGEEIAYELTLQLMSKLVLKKRISTKDLALYVNAMTVACINPRTFFGLDVVAELRERVDKSNQPNPFFLLSLCIAGETLTTEELEKLEQLFLAHSRPSWTEMQAMVVLTLKCIREPSKNLEDTLTEIVLELKRKQLNNGTIDNLKNTALAVQALLATGSHATKFNMSSAIKSIIKGINAAHLTTEEIYYIMPVLKGKTLLDINSNHCESFIKTGLEEKASSLPERLEDQIQVQISIIVGNDKDFTRSWKIKVPSNYSLYQALENITSSEPDYKIRYLILNGKPYVDAVSNFQDSASGDAFWFIGTKPLSSNDDPVFLNESPVDIKVKENEEMILWYRS